MSKDNQYFNRPILEIIRNRHSVRNYKVEEMSKETKEKLTAYAKEIKGPFDAKLRLELIDAADIAEKTGGKIGTYGVIKGAKAYVAGVVEKEDKNMEQLGYCLEKLMLFGESLGLGTCWLGGTFKRSDFAKLVNLKDSEMIPAVTPIGYPAEKRSIVESLMRKVAGSDNRKPWSELFFEGSFDNPLKENQAGDYADALEMVRLAPSASNKQPWRVLKNEKGWHFYLQPTKGYSNALGFNIQSVDMGIAMCHFEMTVIEQGIEGSWNIDPEEAKKQAAADMEYLISWVK